LEVEIEEMETMETAVAEMTETVAAADDRDSDGGNDRDGGGR
jgi:hypothetical protein